MPRVATIPPIVLLALFIAASAVAQPSDLRLINLSTAAGPVDLYLDDTPSAIASNVEVERATFVSPQTPADHRLRITRAQASTSLVETNVTVAKGRRTNVLLYDSMGSHGALVFTLPLNAQTSCGLPDSSHVRFINATSDLGNVDVSMKGIKDGASVTFVGLPAEGETPFMVRRRGIIELSVNTSGGATPVVRCTTELHGARYITVIVSGTSASPRIHMLIDNEVQAHPVTVVETQLYGYMRFVHGVTGVPAFDVHIDGASAPTIPALDYLHASAIVPMNPGTHIVSVKVASFDALSERFTMSADTIYTAFGIGAIGVNAACLVLPRPLVVNKEPQVTMVRIIHGAAETRTLGFTLTASDGGRLEVGGQRWGSAVGYVVVGPGEIDVQAGMGGGDPFYGAKGTLETGHIYTLLASGSQGGGDFTFTLFDETDSTAQMPMVALEEYSLAGVRDDASASTRIAIAPTPASERFDLVYRLDRPDRIRISVVDPLGREAAVLDAGMLEAGEHTTTIPIGHLAAGVYVVRIQDRTGSTLATCKGIVIR